MSGIELHEKYTALSLVFNLDEAVKNSQVENIRLWAIRALNEALQLSEEVQRIKDE